MNQSIPAAEEIAAKDAAWRICADLIKSEELARELNVSLRTIRYWEADGRLPPRVRWGRWLKHSRNALQQWKWNCTGGNEP